MANNIAMRELKLHSPAGVEPAIFTWPSVERQVTQTKKDGVFVGGDEIVKTIRLVFEDYPELYQQNLGLATCDIHSYANMKELCDKFNKIIDTHIKLNRGTEAFSARLEQRATSKLFRHILAQVYSRAVTDPDKLRDYEPFSPSVYGETSPDLIDSILKVVNLNEDQTFIDLGSGVGNVVLHVAALANCKHAYGIEYEETPATYARAMADEFRSWMRWYGKQYSDFQLDQGDFLTHASMDERIREADVIFVNNYVFGSRVNHELKVKFMNMKDGAKIVSSREFCPETFRLNDRTKNDLGAVMHVTKPEEFFGKVSWSDKSVQYYLHVVDHSKLALYYEKLHQSHARVPRSIHTKSNDDDNSLSPLSNNSSSTNPSSNGKQQRQVKSVLTSRSDKNETNQLSHHLPKHGKRKRKLLSTSSSTSPAAGQKTHSKSLSGKSQYDYDSEASDDDPLISKRRRSTSKDYHATLNDLHPNSRTYSSLHDSNRFNYRDMTKLPNDNLDIRHFRDCLSEQEDRHFFDSVNAYLNRFRQRLFSYFTYMKSTAYREHLQQQVNTEKELNQALKTKVSCLENNIKLLLEDTIGMLKLRTNELGIEDLERPVQLITYANDISSKHKELRAKVASLEKEIAEYDHENEKISYILQSIQSNGHPPVATVHHAIGDNTYSTLLASMSKQTQQQESSKPSHASMDKTGLARAIEHSSTMATSLSDAKKNERKSGFIIPKKVKKSSDSHGDQRSVDKRAGSDKYASSHPAGINSLLCAKQLEPVQVHSVGHQSKPTHQPSVIQSVSVKTILNSPSSSSSSKTSQLADEISRSMIMQSPRKKRDFYGKSSGPSDTPPSSSRSSTSSPSTKSHRHLSATDGSSASNNRPSSTPACTGTQPAPTMPDRPVSIPPLPTSS